MSYASASDLKTYLGITSASDDALLAILLGQAQAYIEASTNRKFEASADTVRYFDAWQDAGSSRYTGHRWPVYSDWSSDSPWARVSERIGGIGWQRTLYLDQDLCQITTVVNGDGTTVTSDKYVTEPRNDAPYYALTLKASSNLVWTFGADVENAIAITGRWAYSITAPNDVKMATIELAAYLYRRRGLEGAVLDQPQVSPSGVTIYPPGFPTLVQSVIGQYQKLGGA